MAAAFATRPSDQVAGKVLVHVEAHVGKLQTDVGIQLATADFVQQLVVKPRAGLGFFGVGDILAEIVDGNAETRLIDSLRDPQRIVHLSASHKSAG